MTLSPIQPSKDYLTKEEFRDHDQYMRDGFEKVFTQLDTVEENSINGFKEVYKRFDGVDKKFNEVDQRFDFLERTVNQKFSVIDKHFSNIERKIDNITTLLTVRK